MGLKDAHGMANTVEPALFGHTCLSQNLEFLQSFKFTVLSRGLLHIQMPKKRRKMTLNKRSLQKKVQKNRQI